MSSSWVAGINLAAELLTHPSVDWSELLARARGTGRSCWWCPWAWEWRSSSAAWLGGGVRAGGLQQADGFRL